MPFDEHLVESKVVTREINGEKISLIIKTEFKYIWSYSGSDSYTVWYVWVKELGTNHGIATGNTRKAWTVSFDGGTTFTPSRHEYILSEDAFTDNDGFYADKTSYINSDNFVCVWSAYNNILGQDRGTNYYFTLNCPEDSAFDGFGTEPTQWLYEDLLGDEVVSPDYSGNYGVEASELAISNANIGYDATIQILNDSSSPNIVHRFDYTYSPRDENNAVDLRTFYEVEIDGSPYLIDRYITWTTPMDFYQHIPNDRQGEIYTRLRTYIVDKNGVLQIVGGTYGSFTVYAVEEDCKPTLNPTIYDSNSATVALTGDKNKLIRYKSHATWTAGAVAKHYASISRIEVTNGSQTQTTTGAGGTFEGFTSDYFTFEVTDTRGYTTTYTYTPTIIPYVLLTCIADAEAPTADGELNFTVYGNYYNGGFGAADNSLQLFYRIKEINQTSGEGAFSAWRSIDFELGTNKYTSVVTVSDIDYRNTFIIEAYAVDIFGTIYSDEEATSALPIFDWGINDFNMNCDMTVYGTLTVNGNIVATGNVNGQGSGNSSYEIHYGTCQSNGDAGAKLVTCPTFTNLATGSSIRVKFAYANTAASVVMNVNNTGVVTVKINDDDRDLTGAWKKGAVRDFVYDGTNWIMVTYS